MYLEQERAEYERQQQRVIELINQHGAVDGLLLWKKDPINIGDGIPLRGADLSEVDLSYADLSGADLAGANLKKAKAVRTRFVGAVLDKADMYGLVAPAADFTAARMNSAKIYCANLTCAILDSVIARHTRFWETKLPYARCENARLVFADFLSADCEDTLFRGADLRLAKFQNGFLQGASLQNADMRGTIFSDAFGRKGIQTAIQILHKAGTLKGAKTKMVKLAQAFPTMVHLASRGSLPLDT